MMNFLFFIIIGDLWRNKFLSDSPKDTYEASKWKCEMNDVTGM